MLLIQDIRHSIAQVKLVNESIEIIEDAKTITLINDNQRAIIQNQSLTINQQNTTIKRAADAINQQSDLIKKLFDYLRAMKSIDEWPPSEPINPDNWT